MPTKLFSRKAFWAATMSSRGKVAATTGEISFLLGYADPSSFYRAFHEWTGLTPDRVRFGAA